MNVVLVYPECPETFWSFKHVLGLIEKAAVAPPLGLLTIASYLPSSWHVKLVDMNVSKLSKEDLRWADLVMISAMSVQRASAKKVIDLCCELAVPVVAGGPLFAVESECFPSVQTIFLGEAESCFPQYLEELQGGHPQHFYSSKGFPDLQDSPIPTWELLNLRRYHQMSVQFSRGCPHNCDFCDVTTLFGHQVRIKSVPQILGELDRLYAIGWRQSIFVADDNFIANRHFVKRELLPALAQWRKGKEAISFATQTTIILADDPELRQLMVEAGFRTVFIGIETPEEKSLAECHKEQNRSRDLLSDVRVIQRSGLQIQGGFIVGFDHDPPTIFQQMFDFIQHSGIVVAMVGLLQAFPGTKLYQRLQQENRLKKDLIGDNVCGYTNIIPRMGETLLTGYQSLLRQLYAPKKYYERIRIFLKDYKPPQQSVRIDLRIVPRYSRAFLRLLGRLGFSGKGALSFWRLFNWVLLTRPRMLPLAMTMAAYGIHFQWICDLQSRQPSTSADGASLSG
ncbi:MAG: DUF4070 domain-containing protein [Coprothermobacterota bacterium]|nr:DUF4070 domain-containing protein [Coprothermobacterota bacterium]